MKKGLAVNYWSDRKERVGKDSYFYRSGLTEYFPEGHRIKRKRWIFKGGFVVVVDRDGRELAGFPSGDIIRWYEYDVDDHERKTKEPATDPKPDSEPKAEFVE